MPQNAQYLWAAYTLATALYAGYALSLWLRGRALARREAALGAGADRSPGGGEA